MTHLFCILRHASARPSDQLHHSLGAKKGNVADFNRLAGIDHLEVEARIRKCNYDRIRVELGPVGWIVGSVLLGHLGGYGLGGVGPRLTFCHSCGLPTLRAWVRFKARTDRSLKQSGGQFVGKNTNGLTTRRDFKEFSRTSRTTLHVAVIHHTCFHWRPRPSLPVRNREWGTRGHSGL